MCPDEPASSGYTSPRGLAHEIDAAHPVSIGVDPPQLPEVTLWRKAGRMRLLPVRAALSVETHNAAAIAIARLLARLPAQRFKGLVGLTFPAWWPIKVKIDLRFWLASLSGCGARATLPLVAKKEAAPLIFRKWTPDTPLRRALRNSPVPAGAPDFALDLTRSTLIGWHGADYLLGYGGGYVDRMLAAIAPHPLAVSVGLVAWIATIFPQPHDIPMQALVTETGIAKLEQG